MSLAGTAPTHARNVDLAVERHGDVGRAWVEGLWQGDPLADAFEADLAVMRRGPGMRMLRQAIEGGIDSVEAPPESLVALFAELDVVPDWVDFDQLDRAGDHLARNSLQLGLVLAAASLMVGYTNPAAAYPLILTGRLVDNAGMRNLEVGDWLREVTTHGGMRRDGLGFERTVRVRVIHAMVRRHVSGRPEWDSAVLGTPVSQPYMAHTLSEFGSIALAGMDLLGARYTSDELDDIYAHVALRRPRLGGRRRPAPRHRGGPAPDPGPLPADPSADRRRQPRAGGRDWWMTTWSLRWPSCCLPGRRARAASRRRTSTE